MSLNKNMRVVIVDDYTTMLRILRNLLRQLEINNVDEANDGDTAYHLMQKNPPDLVIPDWNMAPVTGLDLLKRVRADAKLKRRIHAQRMEPIAQKPWKKQAAQAHAAHERAEQHAQRDGSRADHKLQKLQPDNLIDQGRAAAADEEKQQQRQSAARGRRARSR